MDDFHASSSRRQRPRMVTRRQVHRLHPPWRSLRHAVGWKQATAGPRRREPGLRWGGPLGLALVAATSPLTPAGSRRPAGDAPCKRRGRSDRAPGATKSSPATDAPSGTSTAGHESCSPIKASVRRQRPTAPAMDEGRARAPRRNTPACVGGCSSRYPSERRSRGSSWANVWQALGRDDRCRARADNMRNHCRSSVEGIARDATGAAAERASRQG
jgi:hypothetical protein